ncbi:MetQ/NlpA family ABC transporter substrate-binding protein [Olsenella uli]|uniref:MetQ/NlpA family ABC transporter substrate-binding protein n=1 Tax=Olsenella uli TaxID=133926 RepID=UPI0012ABE957|nr:MetQ/NlpA family ABC transporter substrate-binding protein [Olsenella uli]
MSINLSRRSFLLGGAAVLGSFALTACGGNSASSSSSAATSGAAASGSASDGTVITVGASPSPHAEILKAVEDEIKAAGYELKVVEYNDYVQPNVALSEGDLDANYFQHKPYLDNYNQENGTDLVSAAAIHFEPMGIYAGKSSDIKNVPDGAKIAVPSDATNEARALLLLQDQGVLKLKDGVGLEATKNDIAENPHNVEFVEVEAASVPRTLQDADFGVINGNYALSAGLDTTATLASEGADSEAAKTYANIVAVRKGEDQTDKTKALVAALTSDTAKKFIEDTYKGSVIPVF